MDFSSGGNGVSVSNFYARNILTGAGTALLHLANGRFASGSDTTTFSGADITVTNVAFSGVVALQNLQGAKFARCVYGQSFTEDGATCQYNEVYDQRKPYVPIWTQDGGVQPVLGNGTITGSYQRDGYSCTVVIRIVMGSGTSFGNNSSAYRWTLPFRGHTSISQRGIPAVVTIGGVTYPCWASIGANEASFTLGYNGQSVRLGYPAAWAAGSTIDVSMTYLVR